MLKDELETDCIGPAEPWEGLGGMGMPIRHCARRTPDVSSAFTEHTREGESSYFTTTGHECMTKAMFPLLQARHYL